MKNIIIVLALLVTLTQAAPLITGKPSGKILATGSQKVLLLDQTGNIIWKHKGDNTTDCWMLANGNILFTDNSVKIVNPKTDKIVFEYQSPIKKGGGVFGCQPLNNGNILIGENSTGKILEITKDKKILFELQLPLYNSGNHHNLRMVRKLDNGNYLVCHSGAKLVREYTPKGKIVFEVKVNNIAFSAIRLSNGNTLVSHLNQITEFNSQAKPVWSFSQKDVPDTKLGAMCGMHIQPNGNIAIGFYSAYKKGGEVGLFEITKDKKIVWKYSNPKADQSMMGIQILTPEGTPQKGKILR